MAQQPRALGIVGVAPLARIDPGQVFRARRFADFQRFAGELEQVSYLAGHAACHALSNGVSEVVLGRATTLADAEELWQVLASVLRTGIVEAVVVPGLTDRAIQSRLVRAFQRWLDEAADVSTTLWLDAPFGASVADVLEHRRAVSGDPARVRVATPWVPTLTPGRRAAEPLPPGCLVAPLWLGTARRLRGVHELSAEPDPAAAELLRTAGCGLLVPRGPRRQVALAFPSPAPPPTEPSPDPIEEALRQVIEPLVASQSNSPSLWKSIERSAKPVMDGFLQRGAFVAYSVRCDEDTNAGGGPAPVVEVLVKTAKRVREFVLRVAGD